MSQFRDHFKEPLHSLRYVHSCESRFSGCPRVRRSQITWVTMAFSVVRIKWNASAYSKLSNILCNMEHCLSICLHKYVGCRDFVQFHGDWSVEVGLKFHQLWEVYDLLLAFIRFRHCCHLLLLSPADFCTILWPSFDQEQSFSWLLRIASLFSHSLLYLWHCGSFAAATSRSFKDMMVKSHFNIDNKEQYPEIYTVCGRTKQQGVSIARVYTDCGKA